MLSKQEIGEKVSKPLKFYIQSQVQIYIEIIKLFIIEAEMETRYQNLLDELHTNKRQLANYRQKYVSMENQFLSLQQQQRNFKKLMANLKQTNQKLTEQNKALLAEKQALISDYSTSVDSIKQEINKKQLQIYALKQNSFSPLANQKLFEKQLRCQLQAQYEQQLQGKQKKFRDLLQQIDRMNFQKSVQKQKYQLRLEALQKQLKQMQNSHMLELQNYANRTYQHSQSNKISEQQSLIKKLRREIDELRLNLDSTQQQLSESITEKTKLQKQHSAFVTKHKAEIQKYAEQIRNLQYDNQRHIQKNQKNKGQRDQMLLREKDKQIRSLRDKIQELHQKMSKKESRISELQVEAVTKINQIKRLKDSSSKDENQKIHQLKLQKQSYQRQINQLKNVNENFRKQNIQLVNSISDINIKSINNINQAKSSFLNEPQFNIPAQKQKMKNDQRTSIVNQQQSFDEPNQHLDNSFGNLHRIKSSNNLNNDTLSKLSLYKKQYEDQSRRNKQLGEKYVQLKKKYKILEQKFREANAKLVGLLKDKIQLGSPTAASKKSFQFPTSPNQRYLMSPEEASFKNEFHQTLQYSKTQGNISSVARNINFSPEITVSKPIKKCQRSESKSKGEHSFYQKSLKVKNSHKFKEIKCLNHDDPQHDHGACSHSPIK